MLFFYIFLSFICGIIAVVNFSILLGIFLILFVCGFLIFCFQNPLSKILICCMFFGFWAILTHFSISERIHSFENLQNITQNFSGKFFITGTVEKNLYNSDFRKVFRLKIDTIATSSTEYIFPQKEETHIFVQIPKNLTLHTGDTIQFESSLTEIIDWNLKDFSGYAWLQKSYAQANINTFIRIKNDEKNFLDSLQENIKNTLFNNFPRETSALIWGITIGNIDFMTSNMKHDFKNAGLTHILVVSGSNIAFVILIISFFLKYFPFHRFINYGIIGIFLGIYGTLVGWEPPVIRATLMGIISYISISGSSKKIHSISILLWIALIFLLFEPLSLIYDASFWLSFGATFGILLLNSPIENFLKKYISISWIITNISVTLAATFWSFWALIFHFWNFSIVSLFANILISGIMWFLLIWCTFYLVFSFILPGSWLLYLGYPIYWMSEYIFWVSWFFGKFSPIKIPEIIKIPLSILWYFAGFLYMVSKTEKDIIQTNFQKSN